MNTVERSELDEKIRQPIRDAVAAGATKEDIVYLLTRLLPELCPRDFAMGNVLAAYDLAAKTRPLS